MRFYSICLTSFQQPAKLVNVQQDPQQTIQFLIVLDAVLIDCKVALRDTSRRKAVQWNFHPSKFTSMSKNVS